MKRINKKHLTSAILLAAFIALLLMQQVRANPITLSIAPLGGPVGTSVAVSGFADTPGGNVSIYFDINGNGLTEVGEFQKNATASMTVPYLYGTTITVPPSTAGTHAIIATDVEAGTSTGAYFRVVPEITLNPDAGRIGTTVTVTGTGFDRASSTTIKFEDVDVTPSSPPLTSEVGSFMADFSVPPLVKGVYTVNATDAAGNFGVADFNLFGITVSITPTSGPVGTLVAVTGTQATPDGLVKIWWDDAEVDSVTAMQDGTYSYDLTVPPSTAGDHSVTAEDVQATNTEAKTFTVQPKIILSLQEGPVGTSVSVTGTGFAGNAFVNINFDAILVVENSATDSAGSFTADFEVPASVAGAHTVTATDTEDETIAASAQFTVIPQITIDVTEGRIGTQVQVTGTGFAGTSKITLTFDNIDVTPLSSPETDEVGSFTTSFTVPPIKAGAHTLTATDEDDNAAAATFTVWDITIAITPTNGPAGTDVTVTGTNATPEGTVKIQWDGVEVGTTTAGTDGTYSFEFKVPASVKGDHTVAAEDVEATNTASKTFTVEQLIILTPENGVVGDSVLVTGTGFNSLSDVDVHFDNVLVSSDVQTDESGSFSMTFTVPWVSTAGDYTVTATDANSVTDDATFTVLFVMYPRSNEYLQGDYPSFFIHAVNSDGEPRTGATIIMEIYDPSGYLQYKGVTFSIQNGTVPYDMQFFNWWVWNNAEAFVLSPPHLPSDATVGTWTWIATIDELAVKGSLTVVEPVDLQTLVDKLDQLLKGQQDAADLIVHYGEKLQLDHEELAELIAAVSDKLQMDHEDLTTLINDVANNLHLDHENLSTLVTQVFNDLGIKLDDISEQISGVEEKADGLYLVIGNLEVKLDDINATLVDVQGSMATLSTTLGEIETKIDNLGSVSLEEIRGDIATIKSDIGTIKVDVNNINANITSIKGTLATIETTLGTVQEDVTDINAKIVAINGNIATIQTDIGAIKTSLEDINAKISVTNGNVATIQTDVGTIKGKVTSIEGDVATLETDVGTVKTSTKNIENTGDSIKSDTGLQPATVALSLVAAIGAIAAAVMVLRKVYMK